MSKEDTIITVAGRKSLIFSATQKATAQFTVILKFDAFELMFYTCYFRRKRHIPVSINCRKGPHKRFVRKISFIHCIWPRSSTL